jgi:hypothetical protein
MTSDPLQGPSSSSCRAASITRRLQAHRSGSGRGIGTGRGKSPDGKYVHKHNLRALRHVVVVVPQELFLFAASRCQFHHFRHFILT